MNFREWMERIGKWPILITIIALAILFTARVYLGDKQAASLTFALTVIPVTILGIYFLFRRVAAIPIATVATACAATACAAIFLTEFKSDGFWMLASVVPVPFLLSVLSIREIIFFRQNIKARRWHIYATFSGQFICTLLPILGVIQGWW